MTTRSKKKSETLAAATPSKKRIENSWLMFVKDSVLDNSNFSIITVPHPAHGKPVKYCLDNNNNKIYEIVTFDEPNRSWFIGETVKSDGSIQMVTPINPLYLVLPRLKEQCSTRAIPLEDLLSEKGYDKIIDFVPTLDSIADLKGPADMKAYKYNEDKTLSWLQERVHKLAKVLRNKNIHVTSGATSATFVSSNLNNDSVDEAIYPLHSTVTVISLPKRQYGVETTHGKPKTIKKDILFEPNHAIGKLIQTDPIGNLLKFYLKYAFGMISEYLQDDIVELLERKFDFKPDLIETIGKKRKSEIENSEPNKRVKCESDTDTKHNGLENFKDTSFTEVKKEKPLSAKEKARQKAASGTKTISSFFVKK